jgi:hypothetical protein
MTSNNTSSETIGDTIKKPLNRYQLLLNDEEMKLLKELKSAPHFVNMQDFFRMTLKRLHIAKIAQIKPNQPKS